MSILRNKAAWITLVAACIAPIALAGVPYPTVDTPKAIDLGVQGDAPVTVTVALKLRNTDQIADVLQALYSPANPQFHHFISPSQFHARFAPTDETVRAVTTFFQKAGLTVMRLNGNLLSVTGSQTAVEKIFGVSLHTFEIPAHGTTSAYRFRAPTGEPQMKPILTTNIKGVFGLDSQPRFHPHIKHVSSRLNLPAMLNNALNDSLLNTPDKPGLWTVTDFAQYYDVQPLYTKNILGKGRTIGIVTLASFTSSDAFTYWNSLGLTTDPKRITVMNVDGGPGAPSDASGSDETTLDVEQSGGIAPAAKIIVYQAPNTDQGFIDAFASAIESNRADSIATSWGTWEFLPGEANATNPKSGNAENELSIYNDLFVQAAMQGQSLFAAAGDDGAYDANDSQLFPLPQYTKVLSVDSPADEPLITAGGGTTLPGQQVYKLPDGSTYTINIKQEQAWGWDYLTDLCAKLGFNPISCGIFSGGSGGGVSVFFATPTYQFDIPNIQASQTKQSLVDTTQDPPQTLVTLPGDYWGRNVPDLSLNSDPNTGYILPYTSDTQGYVVITYLGGTSFVSQQLNGVTVLLDQYVHGRVGLLNMPLYNLVRSNLAYKGHHAPLRDVTKGDNWFYNARTGYDQATGVGVPDVANLAAILKS